jgi:uncharacterized protein with ParB-like and HNH nuclease domain
MGEIKPNQRIYDVVKDIKEGKYRLPSIQRSFVWEQDRICKLFDSLMNEYPIGSFLVWKPPKDTEIRSRKFTDDYKTGARLISEENPVQPSSYLVVDGQQRLQSLYIGFFGSYDKEYLYFKVDSNPESEENGLRYQFQFMMPEQAKKDPHWVRPKEIVDLKIEEISEFVDDKFNGDTDDVKKIVKKNLGKFIRVFNMEERIPLQEVKEDLPYNDVLEVFVRVNSGGIELKKSDLIFSTVVLNIPDMEREFIELVDDLNEVGKYEFDIDFIIKTSFVLFDKGAKYDVDKLKDKEYLDKLEKDFVALKNALLSTIEFLKNNAKILSKRFLKSNLALIPIVDFIYRQPHQQIPEGQAWKLRQYLYMSFFMRFYSRGSDGKLDVIHNIITQNDKRDIFPIEPISKYLEERTGMIYKFSKTMLNDLDLVLNIIQGGVAEIPQKRGWSLERDHIFPQSVLKKKDIPDELINNVGNLRLINKTRNILKSDSLPENDIEFFGSGDLELKNLFLKAKNDLTKENFASFVQKREDIIFNKVNEFLGSLVHDGTADNTA